MRSIAPDSLFRGAYYGMSLQLIKKICEEIEQIVCLLDVHCNCFFHMHFPMYFRKINHSKHSICGAMTLEKMVPLPSLVL